MLNGPEYSLGREVTLMGASVASRVAARNAARAVAGRFDLLARHFLTTRAQVCAVPRARTTIAAGGRSCCLGYQRPDGSLAQPYCAVTCPALWRSEPPVPIQQIAERPAETPSRCPRPLPEVAAACAGAVLIYGRLPRCREVEDPRIIRRMTKRGSAGSVAAAMAAVVVAAMTVAVASSCVPASPKLMLTHGEIRGQLPKNGLRFIVMSDPTTQLVEVDVRYEVGAREDPPGKAGLAHLVEHLMFEQQPGGPGSPTLMKILQRPALNLNAYTTWDATHFMLSARAEHLDTLVKIEAMRMHDGCSTLSEHEFLREREVVRNEIRSRYRTPETRIPELTLSAIYPPGHAYARMIGGTDEQLSAITLGDVCEFMQQYYVPERAIVVLAGGFAAEPAIRSIEKWFNRLDKSTPAPRRAVEPLVAAGGRSTIEVDVERPWVTVSWPLPNAQTPEGRAVELGIWGAFRYALAHSNDQHDCATRSGTQTLGGFEAPVFMLALELSSMAKLDECLDRVWKTARDNGYDWDRNLRTQLDEAKNGRKAEFLTSLEPLLGRTDQIADMAQFSRDVDFHSRDVYVFRELDQIGKLDIVEVIAAMKRVFDRDRARVTVFAPSKHGATSDRRSDLVFEAAVDDAHEERSFDPSEAQSPLQVPSEIKIMSRATQLELDNGMRVVLLPVDSMPVVAAQLMFNVGEAAAPDHPGLATAAAELLRLPSGSRTAWQAGIGLGCTASSDHTICTAHGVSLYLDIMLGALESLIRSGRYIDEDITRWQRSSRAWYERKRSRQQLAFEREQFAAIYGVEHPYTRTGAPPHDMSSQIGERALTSFRREHYTAANATLVIAGMFDVKRTEALVREAFGYWSRGRKDAPVPPVIQRRASPLHIGVISGDDPQVDVALLYPSPPGIAGEQAARLVLTQMLDAQARRVRVELGATYGVRTGRDARVSASSYYLRGAVDAPRAGEALRAMRAGLDALRSDSDFDAMFVRARRKVVQELLNGSTVSLALARRLTHGAQFGLGPSFHNDLLRDTAALSPRQVKQLLARELDPQSEVIVLFGDRAAVTRAFAEAGIDDAKLVVPDAK
jgi:zinc protease